MNKPVDRSRDLSQPLDRLGPDETLKATSDQLRGTIAESLAEPLTGAVAASDNKLMKFHGMYQQDDRDLRDERRRQKLEPAYQFMIRVRLAGGVCTPEQWLQLDEIGRNYADGTLRLTTRQTFQFHGVLKHNLRPSIQAMHETLLDTIAACGDDLRGIMAAVNPHLSAVHAEVYAIAKATSNHAIPRMPAYHEIWLGKERVASSAPEEPFYGKQYMPRKFKIGFVVPPSNDIDVYTQDLGFIAITGPKGLEGFNITIGGGMGRTDNEPETYPRLGDVIGYVAKDKVIAATDAIMSVQRDYGDRVERKHARFKYTIDDKGLDWIKAEIEDRLGFSLEPARPYEFETNGDVFGWSKGDDGKHHYGLFIQSGRVANRDGYRLMDGLRAIAEIHEGEFRLTPNQNLVIANIAPKRRKTIEALLDEYGITGANEGTALRRNSIACVALPTCGLAMAEAERYLPALIDKLDVILAENGLQDDAITIRMSGCPNGCSRPYVAEIAFTGRAPGKYNVYLGGGFHGQRLNKMYLENVGEEVILAELGKVIGHYAKDRQTGERFGDFAIRAGYVAEVTEGRLFNA
ncbi:MAG: NADPH-dependent assimilatory sulfite reductase hemoprotein subunit [Pararhizobium sp.]